MMDTDCAVNEHTDTRHNRTLLEEARKHMYNSRELCVFDLNKLRDVLEQFVHNDDVKGKLKDDCLLFLNCLTQIIEKQSLH